MRVLLLTALLLLAPLAAADHGLGVVASNNEAPTPDEVQAVIAGLDAAGMTTHTMGASSQDRPIFVVEIVDPESTVPMQDRVHVFIMTQQHGNEPAGTPAALALLEDLNAGHVVVPDDMVLLVMPQSNPDGALANARTGAHGEDINRDHIDVGTPESLAIHAVLKQWDVHMAFDHHEYGGGTGGVGHPSPIGSYDYDITTMWPNHGNVRQPTADMSLEVNEAIKTALAAEGYTHGDYGITTIRAGPVTQDLAQVAGGPDPGILRNSYGLNNVAGLLIESYVPPASDDNPFQSFERRVASQRVVMDAVIDFAGQHGAAIIDAKRESERLNLEQPPTHYIEGETRSALGAGFAHDDHPAFDAHGLPAPAAHGDRYVTALAQARAGLVAALLHPDSSRSVAGGVVVDADRLPAPGDAYYADAQFGAQTVDALPPQAADQDAPGVALVALLAALAAVVLARRD